MLVTRAGTGKGLLGHARILSSLVPLSRINP
jgi:hypothetical protein